MGTAHDRPLIAGIGDRWRGDEGVGPAVIAELRAATVDTDLVELSDPRRLRSLWSDRPLVVVIAGTRSGSPRGRVRRVEMSAPHVDGDPHHDLDVFGPAIVELCTSPSAAGAGPSRLVLLGVEVGPAYEGLGLSLLVADAVPELASRARAELTAFATI